jgi:hypothetical protein
MVRLSVFVAQESLFLCPAFLYLCNSIMFCWPALSISSFAICLVRILIRICFGVAWFG